jgi:hypothetical protein
MRHADWRKDKATILTLAQCVFVFLFELKAIVIERIL